MQKATASLGHLPEITSEGDTCDCLYHSLLPPTTRKEQISRAQQQSKAGKHSDVFQGCCPISGRVSTLTVLILIFVESSAIVYVKSLRYFLDLSFVAPDTSVSFANAFLHSAEPYAPDSRSRGVK